MNATPSLLLLPLPLSPLKVLVAGSAVASGLFVPMLMIGAVLGRIFGLLTVDIAQVGGGGRGGEGGR
mgnify:CR=1 FL=1